MNIHIPKCFLNPPPRTDSFRDLSYSRKRSKGSLFSSDGLGYKISEATSLPLIVETIEGANEEHLTLDYVGFTCQINSRLSNIFDEIMDSKSILELKNGWGDNGKEISEQTYISAIKTLLNYSVFILDNYNVVIKAPEINPVRNGSIDIVWNTENGYLLININEELLGTFFGFVKANPKFKEGEIDLIDTEPSIALWMKDLI